MKREGGVGVKEGTEVIHRSSPTLPTGYGKVLQGIKDRVRSAQLRASLSVNRELIALYWHIGSVIVDRQQAEGWGKSVVERLAADLHKAFPDVGGFSANNTWRMRAFHLAYRQSPSILAQPVQETAGTTLPQAVAEIPWGHNVILIQRVKNPAARLWYARMTLEHGWSRNILDLQIASDLHGRQEVLPGDHAPAGLRFQFPARLAGNPAALLPGFGILGPAGGLDRLGDLAGG